MGAVVRALAVVMCLVPAQVLANAAPPDPSGVEEQPVAVEHIPLVIETSGLPEAEVLDAVRLRLSGRTVLGFKDPRPQGLITYALVRRQPDGIIHVTLIEPTGNAYDRMSPDDTGQTVRAAASALANLVHSVEVGTLAPTRTAVDIPQQEPPEPQPEPQPEAAPAFASPPPVATAPAAPNLELGVSLRPSVELGLAPSTGTGAGFLANGGGAVAASLRWARGATAGLELRVAGREALDLTLLRFRVAATGGWTWRPGAGEVGLVAGPFLEPWMLRRGSSRAPLRDGGQPQASLPLLGALVQVSAGYLLEPAARPNLAVRLGGFTQVAGSFVPDRGARTVVITVEDLNAAQSRALRLGGLELSFGLEVTIWVGLRTQRRVPAR